MKEVLEVCKELEETLLSVVEEVPALDEDNVNALVKESLEVSLVVPDGKIKPVDEVEEVTPLPKATPFNEAIERLSHAAFPQLKGSGLAEVDINVVDEGDGAFTLLAELNDVGAKPLDEGSGVIEVILSEGVELWLEWSGSEKVASVEYNDEMTTEDALKLESRVLVGDEVLLGLESSKELEIAVPEAKAENDVILES